LARELFGDLLPVALAAAFFAALPTRREGIAACDRAIAAMAAALDEFHRRVEVPEHTLSPGEYARIGLEQAAEIERAAFVLDCVDSLLLKFPGCGRAVDAAMESDGFVAEGDDEKEAVLALAGELQRQFVEFVLTGDAGGVPQQLIVRHGDGQTIVASIVREAV
jgi:hypothetical protein